jgi:hypothetical protein
MGWERVFPVRIPAHHLLDDVLQIFLILLYQKGHFFGSFGHGVGLQLTLLAHRSVDQKIPNAINETIDTTNENSITWQSA